MIIPIIYPSAGEFWLGSYPCTRLNYSIESRKLITLPGDFNFAATSADAAQVASLLNLNKPLHLAAPDAIFKRKTSNCIVRAYTVPFPGNSFLHLRHDPYDILIACPELCFIQAARTLSTVDLVKFGHDLSALYYPDPDSPYGQSSRTPVSSGKLLKNYIQNNHNIHGSIKAQKAVKFSHDNSNSPVETLLSLFIGLPESVGGCSMSQYDLNGEIALSAEGKRIVGYPTIKGDIVFYRYKIAVEYNSNSYHMSAAQLTDDTNRQIALQMSGWKYFGITAGNIQDYYSLMNVINAIRHEMNLPPLDVTNAARSELYYKLFK